ncbi:hypothetical protein QYF36_012854 [Acer negundo]|nr:hypothetical protein QYF36_012854 [Acer negundo]
MGGGEIGAAEGEGYERHADSKVDASRQCFKGNTHQNFRGDRNDNGWSYAKSVKGDDIVNDSKKKEMVVKMEEMYWEGSKANSGWLEKCCPDKIKVIKSRFSSTLTVEEDPLPVLIKQVEEKLGLQKEKATNGWYNKRMGSSKGSRKEEGCEAKFLDFDSDSKVDTSHQGFKGDTHQNFRGYRNDKWWSYAEAVKGADLVNDLRKKEMMVKMEEMY